MIEDQAPEQDRTLRELMELTDTLLGIPPDPAIYETIEMLADDLDVCYLNSLL